MALLDLYTNAKLKCLDGTMDLDNDTIKVILLDSNHSFDDNHTQYSDVSSNELATGDGYTAGGVALSSVTLTKDSGKIIFDAADVQWSATGSGITASSAVLYNDTVSGDLLIGSIEFNGEVTASTGNNFDIEWPDDGIIIFA